MINYDLHTAAMITAAAKTSSSCEDDASELMVAVARQNFIHSNECALCAIENMCVWVVVLLPHYELCT